MAKKLTSTGNSQKAAEVKPAKSRGAAKNAKANSDGPSEITMKLFAPGMSVLHRVGLGGLACTLNVMEKRFRDDKLDAEELPGPVVDDHMPWAIEDDSVTLKFGEPSKAAAYLEKLFRFAFQITEDGLIFLPGQFTGGIRPSNAVLAEMQNGLTLTFLQHGKVRNLSKEPSRVNHDPDSESGDSLQVEYRSCSAFKHQEAWQGLLSNQGMFSDAPLKIEGPIFPGAVVRHVAFTSATAGEELPIRALPLYFAMVGCVALPVNRGVGVLVAPMMESLSEFIINRPLMSPTDFRGCKVASSADAALRAQSAVRLKGNPVRGASIQLAAAKAIQEKEIPGCLATTFCPTPWASQQKSRVSAIETPKATSSMLQRYERALKNLPPRIKSRIVKTSTGRGKARVTEERKEYFRTDSVVRPLIAENLARGQPWYAGFTTLYVKRNPETEKPYREQLQYENKGLSNMIADKDMWDEKGEKLVVEALHEAIRTSLGRIREETDGKRPLSQATKNRWDRFRERLRLDLSGSKTEAQLRFCLTNLFSRAGKSPVLQSGWELVWKTIRKDWQLARDLGLLALASYAGRGETETSEQ